MKVHRWDFVRHGHLSLDAIRRVHAPSHKCRISMRKYPAHTEHTGATRPTTAYVVSGSCALAIGEEEVVLHSGTFSRLAGGEYSLRVEGVGELEIVFVWKLPARWWRVSDVCTG